MVLVVLFLTLNRVLSFPGIPSSVAALTPRQLLVSADKLPGVPGSGLHGWLMPDECKKSPGMFLGGNQGDDPVPGYLSKRILLVLGRGSFRGYSGLQGAMQLNKDLFTCTREALAIQKATVRAFLAHIIEPIERTGVEVDVALHTWDCNARIQKFFPSDSESAQFNFTRELIASLGNRPGRPWESRVLATDFNLPSNTTVLPYPNQIASMRRGFQLVEKLLLEGRTYRSVLFWRWDVVPTRDFSYPGIHIDAIDTVDSVRESNPSNQLRPHLFLNQSIDWGTFLVWSRERPWSILGYDQYFSYPGWLMPCVLSASLYSEHSPPHTPKDNARESFWPDLWSKVGKRVELSLKDVGLDSFISDVVEPEAFGIYRGPYGVGAHDAGKWACRYLKKYFGGPSCGPMWQARGVCKALRARTKLSTSELRVKMKSFWVEVESNDILRARVGGSMWSLYPHARMKQLNLSLPADDEVIREQDRIFDC